MVPMRHPYAAVLLEQGHVEEAARLYAEDLELGAGDDNGSGLVMAHRHPNKVWALVGYHECLVRLARAGKARVIRKALDIARAGTDVVVESSCFCWLGGSDGREECCK